MLPESETTKSFWEKPEGKGAKVINIAALIGAGIGLYFALPFIITLLTNLITALALAAVVGIVAVLASDERFRNLLWYAYKSGMRALVSAFIVTNPLAIAKTYITSLKDKRRKMAQQLDKLKGQIKKLERVIATNKNDLNANMRLAQQAKEAEGNRAKALMTLKMRKAGRIKNSTIKYEDMLAKMKGLYRLLGDMEYYSGIMIDDITDDVRSREIEYKTIQSAYSVMKSAKSIIAGGTTEKDMFDEAMQVMVDDIDMKVGEMERFMEISETFITTVDLENGVFEAEGMEMLDKWIENGPNFIFGDKEKIQQNEAGYTKNQEEPITVAQGGTASGNYSDYFKLQ